MRQARGEARAVIASFYTRYLEDRESRRLQTLAGYQALYPGYEDVIALEYGKLESMARRTPLGSSPARDVDAPAGGDAPAPPAPATPGISTIVQEVGSTLGEPSQIGPYRILEPIGKGGMGVVYLAEQLEPIRRRVALKVIKLGMDTHEVLARFESERQALAILSHPNIARVYDAGATDRGRPFFVMEHVPGIPLNQFCDRHQLDTRRRLEIFLQLCDAIQHAHLKGIIHRDLKPGNVLVAYEDGKPVAKIIDFGVAKSTNQRLTEQTVYTEQGQIIGTIEYMSPEQAEMSALDVDARTDIYSLGVILYELLTGTLPFPPGELRQAGYAEMQRRIREVQPPAPSSRLSRIVESEAQEVAQRRRCDPGTLRRQVRGDLDWITMKALDKDRARRYASGSELAADLLRHLHHEPILARPPAMAYRLRKFAMRNRIAVAASGLVALLVGVALVASRWLAASGHFEEGLRHWQRYRDLRQSLPALDAKAREARVRLQSQHPVWELEEQLQVLEQLEAAQKDLELHYNQTAIALHHARQIALPGLSLVGRIDGILGDLYFERYMEIVRGEISPQPTVFQGMVESWSLEEFQRRAGESQVPIASDPSGAEVYCFRFDSIEGRLVPLPFDPERGREDPSRGIVGAPFLEVERVAEHAAFSPPLQERDRIAAIAGRSVHTLSELVKSIGGVAADQQVEVEVARGGRVLRLRWTPFPSARLSQMKFRADGDEDEERALPAGRVLSPLEQLGFLAAAYPLEAVPECRVGVTSEGAPLEMRLPRGSYLFLLRREGYAEARIPMSIPSEEDPLAPRLKPVRLLRPEEIPERFVYVPEGIVSFGGDGGVDEEGLVGGARRLPGFLIGREEVTVFEYLEFLNDPNVRDRIDPSTGAAPSRREPGEEVTLVPHKVTQGEVQLLARRDPATGAWAYRDSTLLGDWPALGVAVEAAREYAQWRSERSGGRWLYRLPTDLQWERSARGADRRAYVWGNQPILSFCRSWPGRLHPRSRPGRVGEYPADESVFGVRDLAGSLTEPVEGLSSLGFPVLRGGSFLVPDAQYYRIANREGRRSGAGSDIGIRLTLDLPAR